MSHLKAGNHATVVDQDPAGGWNEPNILRRWPAKGAATQIGKVGVGSTVQLLHGPFTDQRTAIWWAVRVESDTFGGDGRQTGQTGWMAEFDPDRPGVVNLA